tara:strand:- start:31 stop:252 length:222 start_codon:yes stop_codon:yes gene_type:complete
LLGRFLPKFLKGASLIEVPLLCSNPVDLALKLAADDMKEDPDVLAAVKALREDKVLNFRHNLHGAHCRKTLVS